MIKVKNRRLDKEAIGVLNELIELDISTVAAFRLAKIVRELDNIVSIKNDREVAIIKKFAKVDDKGNIIEGKDKEGKSLPGTFEIKDDESKNYAKEMEKLLNFENEVDFDKLSVEELKLEKYSAKKIMKIDFLFVL